MGAFDLLQERGAFAREADGRYRVDLGNRQGAVDAPSAKFLTLQGERDPSGARAVLNRDRPGLAVAAYHAPDHLWRIPALLVTHDCDDLPDGGRLLTIDQHGGIHAG